MEKNARRADPGLDDVEDDVESVRIGGNRFAGLGCAKASSVILDEVARALATIAVAVGGKNAIVKLEQNEAKQSDVEVCQRRESIEIFTHAEAVIETN